MFLVFCRNSLIPFPAYLCLGFVFGCGLCRRWCCHCSTLEQALIELASASLSAFLQKSDVSLSFILPFFLEGWLAKAEFELVVFNFRSLDPWEGDAGVSASACLKGFVKRNGEKRVFFSSLTACYSGQYNN